MDGVVIGWAHGKVHHSCHPPFAREPCGRFQIQLMAVALKPFGLPLQFISMGCVHHGLPFGVLTGASRSIFALNQLQAGFLQQSFVIARCRQLGVPPGEAVLQIMVRHRTR
jgi:hypothetical protein